MPIFDGNTTTKTEIAAFQRGETAGADYALRNLGRLAFQEINTTTPFAQTDLSYLKGRDLKFVHGDIWVRTYYGDVYERIEGKRTTTVFHDDARTVLGNESLQVNGDRTVDIYGTLNTTVVGDTIQQATQAFFNSTDENYEVIPWFAEAIGFEFFLTGLEIEIAGAYIEICAPLFVEACGLIINLWLEELNLGVWEKSEIATKDERSELQAKLRGCTIKGSLTENFWGGVQLHGNILLGPNQLT
jgi:hypothetical protein